MNTKDFIKRLIYAKYIYNKGMEFLSHRTPVSDAMSILLFHDASEQLLLIVADKLGISTTYISFLDYWKKVKEKGKHLPNRNEMSKLNKMRVGFKHHGILPNHEECRDILYVLNSFFSSVSHDILDIDFSNLSLADLINYDDIRDCIKNAENFLNQENFEESIVESAKAFAFLEKRMEGDYYHSFIISGLASFRGIYGAASSGSIKNEYLRDGFREARDKLQEIIKNLNPLLLGIDIYKYQRFKLLTPIVHSMQDGSLRIAHIADMYKHKLNYNEENALFCFNFVIDTALKFQSESFGLINRNKFQTIKTRSDKTKVYSYVEIIFKEIGVVEKDKIFDNAILTLILEKNKDYWRVNYKGIEGYIELDDTEWIRETKH
jgi:hypothetical protein